MRDFIAGVIWFDAALLLGLVATVVTSERKEKPPVTALRLQPRPYPQRDRIEMSEWHELERRLAVARLKDELAPRVRRWKLKRTLRRMVEWVGL